MNARAIFLAAAIASGLPVADAWACNPCGGTVDYHEWACGYAPRQGWHWQRVVVGTVTCPCGSCGCTLEGVTTNCWVSALIETCGGGNSCEGNGHDHCPDLPDPRECTGVVPPPDREGWALHDGREGTYTPDNRYSYNSTGAFNQIREVGTGRFVVLFPGLGGRDGNVQVVAHGPSNNRCKVESWSGMPDLEVVVHCHGPAAPFEVVNTPFLAYFLATDDGATATREIGHARYDWPPELDGPDPAFQWNSNRPHLPVTLRQDTGDYLVRFRNLMRQDGAAVVTSLGASLHFCQVVSTSIYTVGTQTGTEVRVWCFDETGRLADGSFTLRYEWQRPVSGSPAREGYAFASQSQTASYTPGWQFNSTGASNAAARSATGTYALTYPNLPAPGPLFPPSLYTRKSTVLMSARTWIPAYCKVRRWGGGSDTTVDGSCFNHLGEPADRPYQQVYLTRSHGPVTQP